ncbi:MAG: RNHCP domain-containing protein [Deltaproteobacteria bacterium]|nr:RNHCP domain-containing protein [Deltaproteobacteria bacterium]
MRRDEAFACAWCGARVPRGGASARDHCPYCLRSVHVDRVPGDRAAACGGILQPTSGTLEGRAGVVIVYRCDRCGHLRRNRALVDGPCPDDPAALRLLLAGAPVPPAAPRAGS